MLKILFLLFLLVPLLEIYLFIKVGSQIGPLATVILILITALAGATLLKIQGANTWLQARQQLAAKQLPTKELLGGLILLITGALLLTPGFFTDAIGFILLIQPLRYKLVNKLLCILLANIQQDPQGSVTIAGEYHTEDQTNPDNQNY